MFSPFRHCAAFDTPDSRHFHFFSALLRHAIDAIFFFFFFFCLLPCLIFRAMPPMLIYFRFFTPPLIAACRALFAASPSIPPFSFLPLMFSSRHFLRWIFDYFADAIFFIDCFSFHCLVFILLLLSLLISPPFRLLTPIFCRQRWFADDIYFLFISSSSSLFRRHFLSLAAIALPARRHAAASAAFASSRHASPRRRRFRDAAARHYAAAIITPFSMP
jgi:hypothetical protein